jgi:hypothetical protein
MNGIPEWSYVLVGESLMYGDGHSTRYYEVNNLPIQCITESPVQPLVTNRLPQPVIKDDDDILDCDYLDVLLRIFF